MENREIKREIGLFLDENKDQKLVKESRYCYIRIISISCYVIGLAFGTATEFAFIPPKVLGFYCGDPSLSKTYHGDTISPEILIISSIVLVIIIVSVTTYLNRRRSVQREGIPEITISYLIEVCIKGLILTLCVTSVTKLVLGRHRPHFLDTCQPDTAMNCTMKEFIETFTCTTYEKYSYRFITDSSLSFPSAHCSIAWFVAAFLSFVVFEILSNGIIKLILIAICFTYSVAITWTRINDKRHHGWDAVAGSIIGILGAVYSSRQVYRSLYYPSNYNEMSHPSRITFNVKEVS